MSVNFSKSGLLRSFNQLRSMLVMKLFYQLNQKILQLQPSRKGQKYQICLNLSQSR